MKSMVQGSGFTSLQHPTESLGEREWHFPNRGLGFRVYGLWFRVQSLGLRV